MEIAPIVIFVYNRLNHTQETIKALQKNYLAKESRLIIISDAPKSNSDNASVLRVREYIREISGFKYVELIEREQNYGLAKSIIEGVTSIVNEYGKIIVLEDDLVTNKYFLQYMNYCLNFFNENRKVWHISGWTYPIQFSEGKDFFFWGTMNCWGWGTWRDRWEQFEKNTDYLIETFSKNDIKTFNLNNSHNFWSQVIANRKGKINTWAIYWYASIFKNNGLCMNPTRSYVLNIGNDGSGVHCGTNDVYKSELKENNEISFENVNVEFDTEALKKIEVFYRKIKPNLFKRILYKLKW